MVGIDKIKRYPSDVGRVAHARKPQDKKKRFQSPPRAVKEKKDDGSGTNENASEKKTRMGKLDITA